MDREHFRSILGRYLQGSATPEEIKLIESWYAEMEEDNEGATEDLQLKERYWSAIQTKVDDEKTRRMIPWKMVGIAASLLIAGVVFAYFAIDRTPLRYLSDARQLPDNNAHVMSNETQFNREIVLPDSSRVTLEPDSRLTYTSSFNDSERAVTLEGGAFFMVSRDELRPFLVRTSKLTTRVLGTSFRVEAFPENKKVIVSVETGKVSVYQNSDQDKIDAGSEVILTPNQKIVFDEVEDRMSRMIVESPQVIVPEEVLESLRFEEAPISEIFTAVEEVYGVDLVFDREVFSSCTLTSVISDGDLYNRLDIICDAIGASYEVRGNQIVIVGSPCNATTTNK